MPQPSVVRPAPRISPRLAHAQTLESTIHLNARPETHGPFPGMISVDSTRIDPDSLRDGSVSTYEVRYTHGSSHDVIASHVEVNLDGGYITMTLGGKVVLMAPMETLLYIHRRSEE